MYPHTLVLNGCTSARSIGTIQVILSIETKITKPVTATGTIDEVFKYRRLKWLYVKAFARLTNWTVLSNFHSWYLMYLTWLGTMNICVFTTNIDDIYANEAKCPKLGNRVWKWVAITYRHWPTLLWCRPCTVVVLRIMGVHAIILSSAVGASANKYKERAIIQQPFLQRVGTKISHSKSNSSVLCFRKSLTLADSKGWGGHMVPLTRRSSIWGKIYVKPPNRSPPVL